MLDQETGASGGRRRRRGGGGGRKAVVQNGQVLRLRRGQS